jgi:hypothetical protein
MSGRAWVTQDDQGRAVYKFHQSWLSDTDLCLERARLGLVGGLPPQETDATAVGTAVHLGIETCIEGILEHGENHLSLADLVEVANEEFDRLSELPHFQWVKRKDAGCRSYIGMALASWYREVLPGLAPVATEVRIPTLELYSDLERVINIGGTVDYVDANVGLVDWKTGSAHSWAGNDWQKQRWSVQATLYTFAHYVMGGGDPDNPPADLVVPFTFVVMLDNAKVQTVRVDRRPGDWDWLRRKALAVAYQIESGTDRTWPLNDQHALCSPKWCPVWDACKGADVAPTWPR